MVCNIRPHKNDIYCIYITIGKSLLKHPKSFATPISDLYIENMYCHILISLTDKNMRKLMSRIFTSIQLWIHSNTCRLPFIWIQICFKKHKKFTHYPEMSIFIYKHKRYVYQTTIKLNVLQTPHKSPLKKKDNKP